MVRHCARGRPPLPSPSPTLRSAARDTMPQRRGLFSGAARTLPGSDARANDILYIRVRRREGENVLHRAAGNDVDNFSVDNPLWITAAAGGRLLRGERGRPCGESVNADGGSVNADGAGAKAFAGDGYSQGASFGPMAAISRRGQGGRIYNNTRARVLLRRMCVKPAALTTHSPLKISARPRTATRPPRALPLPPRTLPLPRPATMHSSPPSPPIPHRRPAPAPAQRRALPEHFCSPTRPRRTPAGCAIHSPPKIHSRPHTATRPSRALPLPHAAPTHAPHSPDARPQAARCIPRRPHNPFPAAPRCLSFRSASGTKKTAPHSACAMPNVSVDRRCGRSFGLVSRALFAAVAGRWRVGVGLRPQPWALRSRRYGRVLRA